MPVARGLRSELIKNIVRFAGRKRLLFYLLTDNERYISKFANSGYLKDTGWIDSFNQKSPVDQSGAPIPWVTYSFIEFIKDRVNDKMKMFEYGSGNSTIYYAKKVQTITAVEHEDAWYKEISKKLPENARVIYEPLEYGGAYCRKAVSMNEKYDIIIVDGRDRVNCVKKSLEALNEKGVVVLDDSERKQYREARVFMKTNGYRNIDFWGIAPGIFFNKCTTIFYKEGNCLLI